MSTGCKKKSIFQTISVAIIMLMLAFGVIKMYQNVNRQTEKQEKKLTEVESILAKDLKKEYPASPREVVKMYLRIMTAFYNEELDEETLYELSNKARELFDEELLENNPSETYFEKLKDEISKYHENEIKVDSYDVQEGSAIRKYKREGKQYALVIAKVVTRDSKVRSSVNEKFVLRENQDGNYKILGWKETKDALE